MHNSHQTNNPPHLTNAFNIPFRHGRFWLIGVTWIIVGVFFSMLFLCLCLILSSFLYAFWGASTGNLAIAIAFATFYLVMQVPLTLLTIHHGMRVFDMKPAFVVSDEGIIDNSNIAGFGFIPWKEVIDVKMILPGRLQLSVGNAQYYIDRENSFVKRFLLKNKRPELNNIIMSTRYAKIKPVDFNQLIEERRKKAIKQQ